MRLELRLNDLQDYITRVHISYSRMQHYVRAAHKYEQLTMEDFAGKMISHDLNSVVSLIERIHAFVAPQDEGYINSGILEMLAKTFEEVSPSTKKNNGFLWFEGVLEEWFLLTHLWN